MPYFTIVSRLERADESPYPQSADFTSVARHPLSEYGRNMAREVGKILRGHEFDLFASSRDTASKASLTDIAEWATRGKEIHMNIRPEFPDIDQKKANSMLRIARMQRRASARVIELSGVPDLARIVRTMAILVRDINENFEPQEALFVLPEFSARVLLALMSRMTMKDVFSLNMPKG